MGGSHTGEKRLEQWGQPLKGGATAEWEATAKREAVDSWGGNS